MTSFPFKSQPFPHQLASIEAHHDDRAHGRLWEMGVGKTMPTIVEAAHLASQGRIGGLLVVAPNGVHTNWVVDELPRHMAIPYRAHAYYVTEQNQAEHERHLRWVLSGTDFPVLAISYHALLQERLLDGTKTRQCYRPTGGLLLDFVRDRKAMIVFDESSRAKNPIGEQALRCQALARYSGWKRILEGTPVANGAFDVYAQFLLLDDDFWLKRRIASYTAFKAEFGVFKKINKPLLNADGTTRMRGGKPMLPEQCVGYRNLDTLYRLIKDNSHRLLKDDVLDLPKKLYEYRPFDLSPKARNVYDKLKKEFMVELESGALVTATLPIVRLLRLAQVTSNYLPVGYGDEQSYEVLDAKHNPRLDILREVCDEVPDQTIIWCRFAEDTRQIMDALRADKKTAVRFDGDCSDKEKRESVETFKAGGAQFIVGRTQSGLARGHTLIGAKFTVYYNNTFSLGDRLQSEDRNHRIGQDKAVTYIDLIARNTVDRRVIDSLKGKFDVAAQVTNDRLREWLA